MAFFGSPESGFKFRVSGSRLPARGVWRFRSAVSLLRFQGPAVSEFGALAL